MSAGFFDDVDAGIVLSSGMVRQISCQSKQSGEININRTEDPTR